MAQRAQRATNRPVVVGRVVGVCRLVVHRARYRPGGLVLSTRFVSSI
jgi:hypothetical protein